MKIKLTQNVVEHDSHGREVGLKTTKKRNKSWVPPKVVDGAIVQSSEPQFTYIAWVPGTVIEVSDETGKKLIERKQAVVAE